MLYAAWVSVWARWLLMLVAVVELAYRPELWYATDKEYLFLSVPLPAFNGFLHYRLRRDRAVTWRWLLFLSAVDIALITAVVIIGGDFHLFSYVAYYPALALFAVVFPHLWLSLAWATMAGAIYAVVSLMVGPGLDFDAGQAAGVRGAGEGAAAGAHRALPDHSRHGRADRLHDQPCAEMRQSGTEPPLAVETRTRLFSIAHNALTNAFLHAHASCVERLGVSPSTLDRMIRRGELEIEREGRGDRAKVKGAGQGALGASGLSREAP